MVEPGFLVHVLPADGGITTVGVVGPITHATTRALRDALRTTFRNCLDLRLRLDLSCCTSIDLDGMLALAAAQQDVRAQGGELYLVRVPPLIDRQLRQHNLDALITDPAADKP